VKPSQGMGSGACSLAKVPGELGPSEAVQTDVDHGLSDETQSSQGMASAPVLAPGPRVGIRKDLPR